MGSARFIFYLWWKFKSQNLLKPSLRPSTSNNRNKCKKHRWRRAAVNKTAADPEAPRRGGSQRHLWNENSAGDQFCRSSVVPMELRLRGQVRPKIEPEAVRLWLLLQSSPPFPRDSDSAVRKCDKQARAAVSFYWTSKAANAIITSADNGCRSHLNSRPWRFFVLFFLWQEDWDENAVDEAAETSESQRVRGHLLDYRQIQSQSGESFCSAQVPHCLPLPHLFPAILFFFPTTCLFWMQLLPGLLKAKYLQFNSCGQ